MNTELATTNQVGGVAGVCRISAAVSLSPATVTVHVPRRGGSAIAQARPRGSSASENRAESDTLSSESENHRRGVRSAATADALCSEGDTPPPDIIEMTHRTWLLLHSIGDPQVDATFNPTTEMGRLQSLVGVVDTVTGGPIWCRSSVRRRFSAYRQSSFRCLCWIFLPYHPMFCIAGHRRYCSRRSPRAESERRLLLRVPPPLLTLNSFRKCRRSKCL